MTGPSGVDPEHYRSEAFLARELAAVFPATWIAVARISAVPTPGSFACFDEVGAALIVTRDARGEVQVFHNRCRHRHTRLVNGHGQAQELRCPYHGWRYALDGALKDAPGLPLPLRTASPGLERARSACWGGMVWVNLDGKAPPLETYLMGLGERLAPYGLDDMVPIEERAWELPCNWKAVLDNTNEVYHLTTVHPLTLGGLGVESTSTEQGPHYEIEMRTPVSRLRRWADQATLPKQASFAEAERSCFRKILVFPNTLINVLPYHLTVYRPFPLGPRRCRLHYGFYRPRRASALGRLRARAAWAWSRLVWREDLEVLEMFQRGVDSGGQAPMSLHPLLESPLAHFHRTLEHWVDGR